MFELERTVRGEASQSTLERLLPYLQRASDGLGHLAQGTGRVQELALRGALGATGILFGIGASLGLTLFLRFWLFGIGVVDVWTLVGVVVVLGSA